MRSIQCVSYLDKEHLWTSDTEGQLNSWDFSQVDAQTVPPYVGHPPRATTRLPNGEAVCSLCQASDGSVIGGCDGSLVKLHPVSMKVLRRVPRAHRSRINAVVCAQDEVLSGSEDHSIAVWNYKVRKKTDVAWTLCRLLLTFFRSLTCYIVSNYTTAKYRTVFAITE